MEVECAVLNTVLENSASWTISSNKNCWRMTLVLLYPFFQVKNLRTLSSPSPILRRERNNYRSFFRVWTLFMMSRTCSLFFNHHKISIITNATMERNKRKEKIQIATNRYNHHYYPKRYGKKMKSYASQMSANSEFNISWNII